MGRGLRKGVLVFASLTVLLMALPSMAAASTAEALDFHYVCVLGNFIGSGQWWTPVILLDSPYLGSAAGSSSTSTGFSLSFFIGTYSTSTTTSSEASAVNGDSVGVFQLDDYKMYYVTTRAEPGPGQNCQPPGDGTTALMTGTTGHWYETSIMVNGPGTYQNDINNQITQVKNVPGFQGNSGVDFNNMYQTEKGNVLVCDPPYTQAVSNSQEESLSLSVAISYGSVSTSAGLTMSSSASNAFSYTFDHAGNYDYYSLDGSSSNGGWAFDYSGNPC